MENKLLDFIRLSDDTVVPVKSFVFGGLTYKSQKSHAIFKWDHICSTLMMKISEIKEMIENNPKFIYNPYVIIQNKDAILTLGLEDLYKDIEERLIK